LYQLTVPTHERVYETIRGVVGLPAEEILRVYPAAVHPIFSPASNPDDAPVLHGYIQSIAVRMEYGGRLYPAVHHLLRDALFEELIYTNGPLGTRYAEIAG
jgi:hypothetical protein